MKDYTREVKESCRVVEPFMEKTFANIIVSKPLASSRVINENPTLIVCSHRSHLDYILLGIQFNSLGLKNLRFAAGDNLTNMPFVGKKFRSWGAFSVYRSRSTKRNYIFKLCEQVIGMLNNGENIILFPEGGRSYKGHMLELKNGLLAANVFAQYRSPDKTYFYFPATVSYERLPELSYFDLLLEGKAQLKENGIINKIKGNAKYYGADLFAFAKFIGAHKIKKNYGDVYIDFGEPVAVNDIVDLEKNYIQGKRNDFSSHKESLQIVGNEIRLQFLKLYRILPIHILASILLTTRSCTIYDAECIVSEIISKLQKQNRNCKSLVSLSEKEIVEKAITQLRYYKAIIVIGNMVKIRNLNKIQYFSASLK